MVVNLRFGFYDGPRGVNLALVGEREFGSVCQAIRNRQIVTEHRSLSLP
jgi:hypothetical protein